MTTVLVIGGAPDIESLDALLSATSASDVVFVESIEHCYACIRKIVPDRVIIASDVEDIATCRLLSMMRVDRCMSGVPVLTSDPRLERFDLDDEVTGLDQGAPIRCFVANTH